MGEFKYIKETGRFRGKAASEPELANNNFDEAEIVLIITVTAGPHQGESISYHGSLGEEYGEYTVRDLRTMGWKGDDVAAVRAADLPNEFNFQVVDKGKDGKTFLKVRYIDPLDRQAPQSEKKTLPVAQKRDVAAKFRNLVKLYDAKNGTPAATAATKGPAASAPRAAPALAVVADDLGADDDIPF